ncbi:D-alanyl-lipoteichoic acid biosynthesis protein DltB [Bacillus sporothermodurans]|uniref:D-alanyl-lipoteichoic acid biosynthesis protein DltB n=1 Tax=Heyndrickxia sporothermodurans TaxID=46224 RepID=UPI00192C7931|nr:D-alanyl-lipoteichoic acid biosynthesis protein DltB [Heyndrickxia sporothermodurans]MBL5846390.1 D-alanyl-lipoteichoic acid biosynthesis protein DltB [Heyndrickxia sporothermodurans]
MIPYESFLFFFIVAFLLLPTIILGLNGKVSKAYNMVVTVLLLAIIFSNNSLGAVSLVLFTIWQVILVKGYAAYRKRNNRTLVFCLAFIASILPLVLVKVFPLLGLNHLFGFLGISYLTFKAVQMVIEIRDGIIKNDIPLLDFLYFLLFFPTISSGPIDRYRRFEKDRLTVPTKEQYRELLYLGINKIFKGFLYKFIIAYLIHRDVITHLYPGAGPFIELHPYLGNILYMYSYSMYLFFDFAWYSAFAIGVSYLMGIKTPENFNLPFISRNIKDFWNRWHMTLSFWFRDYVYMRFVLWMTKKKWIKNRYTVSNLGYLLLFLIMGLWHGIAPQYIVYGLYQAFLMVSFDFFDRWNRKTKFWPKNKVTHVVSVVITFHFICFGFYIFSGYLFH